MWVISAGWRIEIADSYSVGGKCKEENTKYKMRLPRLFSAANDRAGWMNPTPTSPPP